MRNITIQLQYVMIAVRYDCLAAKTNINYNGKENLGISKTNKI